MPFLPFLVPALAGVTGFAIGGAAGGLFKSLTRLALFVGGGFLVYKTMIEGN